MPDTARIPLLVRENERDPNLLLPDDPSKGALLRLGHGEARDEVWLITHDIPPIPSLWGRHKPFCSCCSGQNPLVTVLRQLFMDRVRRRCPLFSFVCIACQADQVNHVRQVLEGDVLVSARYKF